MKTFKIIKYLYSNANWNDIFHQYLKGKQRLENQPETQAIHRVNIQVQIGVVFIHPQLSSEWQLFQGQITFTEIYYTWK
jgi:hypothetical protein